MSFKGFQKAIIRAPQTFRQKMNIGETTTDPVYADAERRFKELESETKSLSEESKRYHKAVNDMLDHQLGFSKAIEEIYKPISGRMSDPNSAIPEGNPEGIEACEQYTDVVNELKDILKPDLELIDSRIIQPSQELLKIIQSIRKMATKRAHKQLDLDRHQNNLKKHQNKKERTAKDEEKIYKYENDVSVAQQEYDYYNEMLKTELPILFRLEGEFIKPLFISLYYMQLNVFYTLSSRMEEMKIPYFDLSTDIIEAYNYKRGNIEEQVDSIGITNFKVGHAKSKLDATRRRFEMQQNGYGGVAPVSPTTDSTSSTYSGGYGQTPPTTASTYGQPAAPAYGDQKTPYGQPAAPAYGQPAAPTYGQPAAPTYGQPAAPTYGQPAAPTYGQPAAAPVYGDQKTPYGQPAPPAAYGQPASPTAAYGQPAAPVYGQPAAPTYGAASPTYGASSPTASSFGAASPTAYGNPVAAAAPGYGIGAAMGSPSPAPAPVPVAPAAPAAPAGEMCTALYDYTAQAAGDLSFKAGQQISIVQRTADQNGWWTGSCNGLTGVFPGNYVRLN